MSNDSLATFTDRREAIALFDVLRGRNPGNPWPLLPILVFVAQGGSGKSTLIEYLRVKHCALSEQRVALPYARLDFTLPDAPKDVLSILIAIRDQLQQHDDGYGKHLTFPRFDLGALVAQSMPTPENLASFGPQDVRHKLDAGLQPLESLANLGSELGLVVPFMLPILAGIRLAGQSRPVQKALRYFEEQVGWKWYGKIQGARLGLGASAGLEDVLRRLAAMSMPGKPERALLIEEVLPAAFMADIIEALVQVNPPLAWSKTTNVVLFLDGFEQLQQVSSAIATRLLQVLTIEQRREGQTDPLLLVIGTRSRFSGFVDGGDHPSFEEKTSVHDEHSVQQQVRDLYERWRRELPGSTSILRLKDLYLSLILRDFGLDDTRTYLMQFGKQERTQLLADGALVQAIARVTHGHPLSLALAAAALVEAKERGRVLSPDQFDEEYVSEKVVRDHERGHEEERIRDYLLELFLRQLEKPERDELIFCAAPRSLDVAILRATLQLPTDVEARRRWERYARFTFTTVVEHDRLVLHPLVRTMLLRHIPPDDQSGSDYNQVHQRLRTYFQQGIVEQKQQGSAGWQARLEDAYHALALGDAAPAVALGVTAQQTNLTTWELLLAVIAEAPVGRIPSDTEQQAYDALLRAERHHDMKDAVRAIILYEWLTVAFQDEPQEVDRLQNNLGNAYWNLPGGDRQANLERAIACYEAALQVRTREAFPVQWAMTQNNLGTAYRNLPGGDRQANLERAIACYEAALQVYTREAFPVQWAMTQNNLGTAYWNLPGGDRQANLERAIACYEAALQVYTREAFPVQWAMTQNNLGTAYRNLPGGDRQANLERAIACYEAALQVYTREAFPVQWAMTQNNLGNAYSELPGGDRQANLERAIACYEAALQVRTREAFPVQWAGTQNNLGTAYWNLPGGDRQANLERAIACYEAALAVFKMARMVFYIQVVDENLKRVREDLGGLEQD